MRLATAFAAGSGLLVCSVLACSKEAPPSDSGTSSGTLGGSTSSSSGGKKTTSSSSGSTAPPSNVNLTSETMEFDGAQRKYLLGKPKQYDASKKYPLVFNLHGNPGTAEGEAAGLPFDQVSKQDAVIVYPLAADGAEWDWTDGSEDMKWFKPLVAEVATKASIDTTRVLGFGYSGGAYFLSQYACKIGGVLKAAAILSGGAPEIDNNGFVDCPGGKLPIIIMHGQNDNTEVPFEGGDYAQQCWAHNNRCNDGDLAAWGMDPPCQKYNGCDDNPVVWCAIPNQGHDPWVPGMQAAWDFFKSLP